MTKKQYTLKSTEKRIETARELYDKINLKRENKVATKLDGYYYHEATSPINVIGQFQNFYTGEPENDAQIGEIIESVLPEVNKQLDKLNKLEKILKLKDFSKKESTTDTPTNLRDTIQDQIQAYNSYLRPNNINVRIEGEGEVYIKPEIMDLLLSTNIGDSVKWAPKHSDINIDYKRHKNFTKIHIKNAIGGRKTTTDIGLGAGIGTMINNDILNNLGGIINSYKTRRKASKDEPIWNTEILIPNIIMEDNPTLAKHPNFIKQNFPTITYKINHLARLTFSKKGRKAKRDFRIKKT